MGNSLEEEDISDIALIFDNSNILKVTSSGITKPTAAAIEKCGNCGKTNKLAFCQCKTIKYCNMECLQ